MQVRHYPPKGFTLFEMLFVLGLLSVIFAFALPSLASISEKTSADNMAHLLMSQAQLARSTAINHNKIITICGSADGISCNKTASTVFLIFDDVNNNRRRDGDEILYSSHLLSAQGSIRFSVSRGAMYLRYRPEGTAIEFGNITYCPDNRTARYIQSIIINYGGRPRLAGDRNGDGIREDANGTNLSC